MAVPQRKTSKAKSRSRRSQNMKVSVAQVQECPQCSALKRPHTVCSKCGYYKDEPVYEPKFRANN